jgi:iron complex outermembrane receptor protein
LKTTVRRTVHSKVAFAFAASLGTPVVVAVGYDCPIGEPAPATHISIPAQPLNGALQALAAQTGLDILFEPATVAGLKAGAVRGEMQPSDALCLLLGDRGLIYSINPDHTIIISKRASRQQTVPRDGTVTELEPIANVIVTGTRRADRSVESSLVPIAVVEGDKLSETGSTDTAQTLAQLLPGLNYPQPAITDGTDIVRPVTLRGLQPDEMLVLVDGKRRHTSALLNINTTVGRGAAGVDMSMLPAAAIERVEVLSDDAAAQYGSDAIAGVVNVLLKKQRAGADVNLMYGQTYTNIKDVPEAVGVLTQPNGQPVTMGAPLGNVYALRYNGDREAHDGQTVSLSANVGLPLGSAGFLDIAGQGRDQAPTNRAGYDPLPQYQPLPSGLADPRELTFNRLSQRFGEPRIEDAALVANAGLPLSDTGAEWYAFATYGARYGLTTGIYRSADDPATLTSLYPNGFLPLIKADVNDESLVSGLRGALGLWNYDLSANFGRDVMNFETEDSDNVDLDAASPTSFQDGGMRYQEYLLNLDLQRDFPLPMLVKPLSVAWGLEYRAERYAITAGAPDSYSGGQTTASGGSDNPPPTLGTAQAFPGFRPINVIDQARHSSSAYVDLEQDLTPSWTLAVAGRAERYSDFGSTVNFKVASRVSLLPGLALRGSMSTGFKAPSLQQQYFSTISTNEISGNLTSVGTFAVTDRAAKALGATDLKPEKSRNLGAGIVFDRIEGLDIAADWYRIAISDRIVLTDNLGTEAGMGQSESAVSQEVEAILTRAGYSSLQAARFFINGVDTLTQGADIVGSYHVPLQRFGDVHLSAAFNDSQTRITGYHVDAQDQSLGVPLFGQAESDLLTRGQPRTKLNLSAEWSRHELAATLRTNRYGSVLSPEADPRDDLLIRPAWVTDVELRYTRASWRLALGAQNVFDQYPTVQPTGARPISLGGYYNVVNYFAPFSVLSPFGFNGRFLYARMSYKF